MPTTTKPITPELVTRILSILSHGLTKGLGQQEEGKMCIEAAICCALGEPHGDNPSCVGEEIRKPKINLNDCNWSTNAARAEGMKYIAIAQLGSIELDQNEFTQHLKLLSTKRILPYLIQKHYDKLIVFADDKKDAKLLEYKTKFEALTVLDDEFFKEFYYYYYHNYNYYNYYNYYYYHNYNYYNYYNYYYNYYNYNYYNYYNNYGDEFLLLVADVILQTLKDMNCEGCKWLHLAD